MRASVRVRLTLVTLSLRIRDFVVLAVVDLLRDLRACRIRRHSTALHRDRFFVHLHLLASHR